MNSDTNASIKAIYTERSSTYDNSPLHPRQANEYIDGANLQQGESVLDLACGTGLVTIPAKQHVGPAGKVTGIDISSGMLDVARQKTSDMGLDITYIEHDITDLSELKRSWEDSMLLFVLRRCCCCCESHCVLSSIGLVAGSERQAARRCHDRAECVGAGYLDEDWARCRAGVGVNDGWVESEDSLGQLLIDAGLVVEELYESEVYETRDYNVEEGPQLFEKAVANPMFRVFGEPAVRDKAKEMFVEEFRGKAGEDGVVREEVGFYMWIAGKDSKE